MRKPDYRNPEEPHAIAGLAAMCLFMVACRTVPESPAEYITATAQAAMPVELLPTATYGPTHTPTPTPTTDPEMAALRGEGWGIYLTTPDNRFVERLTPSGLDYQTPQFSPDGGSIAFIQRGDPDSDSLLIYDLETRETSFLFQPDGTITGYAWSPDSTGIAVLVRIDDSHMKIVLVERENPAPQELLSWDGQLYSLSWSFDGSYLAFATAEGGAGEPRYAGLPTEVFMLEIAGNQLTQLTDTGGMASLPAWSPVAPELIYLSDNRPEGGGSLVLVHPLDRESESEVVDRIPQAYTLVWSPDGEWLSYGFATGASAIHVEDGASQGLMFGTASYFPVDWSPDGHIAVVQVLCCGLQLTYLVDTTVPRSENITAGWSRLLGARIENNKFWVVEADWSPVEDLIVFAGLWEPPIP